MEHEPSIFEKVADDIHRQGFSVCKKAVPPKILRPLQNYIYSCDPSIFRVAGVGRGSEHKNNSDIRSDRILWIDEGSESGSQWLSWANMLQLFINRQLMLNLRSFESHVAIYDAGAFYRRHIDAFRGQENRRLSLVVYLNNDWSSSDGGELVIYSNDGSKECVRVLPELGTLAVFLSEEFPHEVLSARRQRTSIAGWFR